jgi:hypothetical protein
MKEFVFAGAADSVNTVPDPLAEKVSVKNAVVVG